MITIHGSFVDKVFLEERHVLHRLHMPILVVGKNEKNVGLSVRQHGGGHHAQEGKEQLRRHGAVYCHLQARTTPKLNRITVRNGKGTGTSQSESRRKPGNHHAGPFYSTANELLTPVRRVPVKGCRNSQCWRN